MTLEESIRLLEERDARLSQLTRVLSDLLQEAEFAPPLPALSLACLNAKLALEHEGMFTALSRDQLCQRSAWCSLHDRHSGPCTRAAARVTTTEDFGPEAARRRRY